METIRSLARRVAMGTQALFARLLSQGPVVRKSERVLQSLTLICAIALGLIIIWLTLGYGPTQNYVSGQQQRPPQPSPSKSGLVIDNSFPSNMNSPKDQGRPGGQTKDDKNDVAMSSPFHFAAEKALTRRGMKLSNVCASNDPVARRVLEDYGAMYVASDRVLPPNQCVFVSEQEVTLYQETARYTSVVIGSSRIELQPAAMNALIAARAEAHKNGLDITPRGGAVAARRSYEETVRLWHTRFLPGLNYWQQRGRITKAQAARLRQLPLQDQVKEVLDLEKNGIFFSKDLSKSILYSIAAPGTSQHIAMLALDVAQFSNGRVRQILARHGWFQTVKSDMPHFTYLGVEEKDLLSLGLRAVSSGGQVFWIPNLEPVNNENPPVKK